MTTIPQIDINPATVVRRAAASMLCCFFVATAADAAVIAQYDISNANAGVSNTVGVAAQDPFANASAMVSQGALGTPFNVAASFCYLAWPSGPVVDSSKYYEFSIAADSGYEIDFQSADFAVASGGSGTGNWTLRGSTDGFGSSDILLDAGSFAINATWQPVVADLSSLGSQSGSVTFRFYMAAIPTSGFAGLGQNPVFGANGQDFFVRGEVNASVVPLPATLALMSIGLVGLGARRRKA